MARRDASIPDWPASMKRATAARYCDLTLAEFESAVTAGKLPLPISEFCSAPLWSRRDIDEALERARGAIAPDWRSGCKLYGQG